MIHAQGWTADQFSSQGQWQRVAKAASTPLTPLKLGTSPTKLVKEAVDGQCSPHFQALSQPLAVMQLATGDDLEVLTIPTTTEFNLKWLKLVRFKMISE